MLKVRSELDERRPRVVLRKCCTLFRFQGVHSRCRIRVVFSMETTDHSVTTVRAPKVKVRPTRRFLEGTFGVSFTGRRSSLLQRFLGGVL